MRLGRIPTFLILATSIAGCFQGSSTKSTQSTKQGQLGVFYIVNVSRPVGGTITSADGQINCGLPSTGKDACGPATYSWNVTATLTAVPNAGQVLMSWAGDCTGSNSCVLDTRGSGADKWVVAVFNAQGQVGHGNIMDPALHGPMFFSFVKKEANAPKCNVCHGADYRGLANAPSCEACHAQASKPDWLHDCTFCHGDPPVSPHVQVTNCSSCHAGYGDKTGAGVQATNPFLHMNGVVDVSGAACTSCHGTNGVNAAPPADLTGGTSTTLVSVGAHQAHLTTTIAKVVACGECHVVPSGMGHATTPPAQRVVFGNLANQGTPTTWDRGQATCASNYCHGGSAALSGGLLTTPIWTTVNGSFSACTSCHGLPPPAPHPQNTDCGSCHAGYSVVSTVAATHVNGVVDVRAFTCTSCHGDPARAGSLLLAAAPPNGTRGENQTTDMAVGAHQAHLNVGPAARAMACTDCHNPPTSTTHATGVVEFSWSVLATGGGTGSPAFDPLTGSCASTYCHGGTTALTGGTATVPVWNRVDGTFGACTACHGAPPPLPHAQSTACGSCHPGYTQSSVNFSTHVNGIVEVVALSCTSCHGTTNGSPAPPADTHGGTATSLVSVGAHQSHVTTTLMAAPIACTGCHGPASASYTTAHSDGTVQVAFGPLANQGTFTVWSAGNPAAIPPTPPTCATSYCHGGTAALAGGTGTTPVWNVVNGSFKACTSCHGAPPPAPHTASTSCGACHAGYTSTSVNAATHINGTVEAVLGPASCTLCHGDPPALTAQSHHPANPTCATCHGVGYSSSTVVAATHNNGAVDLTRTGCTLCHGDLVQSGQAPGNVAAPGVNATAADTTGATAATSPGVGAHAAHLVGTRWRVAPLACTECHVVPGAGDVTHATGAGTGGARATLSFGALATTGGIATATYAGSSTAANGATAGTCSNTYCHGNFSGSGATGVLSWTGGASAAACGTCHGAPPPGPHPSSTDCGACHPGYTSTSVNPATHIDGRLDVNAASCTTCHGTPGRTGNLPGTDPYLAAAPPVAPTGAPAYAVGAHESHVNPPSRAGFRGPVLCGECHVLPGDSTHATTPPAQLVVFGSLARAGGANPTYSATVANATCASTYCHGSFSYNGVQGAAGAPQWTDTGLGCVNCHGLPPTGHPALAGTVTAATCSGCHPSSVNADGTINVATGAHVNGQADVAAGCTSCHGDPARTVPAGNPNPLLAASPPVAPPGVSTRAVGTHQLHLNDGAIRKAVTCDNCHVVPSNPDHSITANPVVVFTAGTLATTQARVPAYDGASFSCSATYCHGNFDFAGITGAAAATPAWDSAPALSCTGCHGMPPTGHTALTPPVTAATCNGCHPGTVKIDGTIDVAGGLHMNGAADFVGAHPVGWAASTSHGYSANQQGLQACTSCHVAFGAAGGAAGTSCNACHTTNGHASWQTECTFCHGTAGRAALMTGTDVLLAASPPVGPQGQTATADALVGAHQRHVNPPATGANANPLACRNCHATPLPADVSHVNGQPVPVPFGGIALTGNITTAAFNPTTLTCSATYCHGNFTGGVGASASVAPVWTGGAMTCTSCHAAPPATGEHGRSNHRNAGCGACHSGYSATAANPSLHVNGVKDVGGAGTSINTWVAGTGRCTPTSGVGCHGTQTW